MEKTDSNNTFMVSGSIMNGTYIVHRSSCPLIALSPARIVTGDFRSPDEAAEMTAKKGRLISCPFCLKEIKSKDMNRITHITALSGSDARMNHDPVKALFCGIN